MNLFITGTDTNVGKTYVCALLVKALRNAGHNTAPMKPFCCGSRDDARTLYDACGGCEPLDVINPAVEDTLSSIHQPDPPPALTAGATK